jgi:hypothetical protein
MSMSDSRFNLLERLARELFAKWIELGPIGVAGDGMIGKLLAARYWNVRAEVTRCADCKDAATPLANRYSVPYLEGCQHGADEEDAKMTERGAQAVDGSDRAYGFLPATSCRCVHCGWLVPAKGVTLMPGVDVAYDEDAPERCADAACVSEMVCDAAGRPAGIAATGYVVIGHGKAGPWSDDASAVERGDADLIDVARSHGLFDRAQRVGYSTTDGELLDDGWLLVVGAHDVETSTLDADPSVIAYSEVRS